MAEGKRYYWLKFKEDFFQSKRIKKLRKVAGGDTYVIIYLKMQLMSLKTGGKLTYTMLEDNFAEELALDIDERPEDVAFTLSYLANCGLIETSDNINFFLPFVAECVGSENASAARVREYRERQKALQCNTDETEVKRIGNVEKEKEKEKEIELDIDIEREEEEPKEAAASSPAPKPVKHKHGQFGRVRLTDKEYEKLLQDLGEEELERCIEIVDYRAEEKNNKYGWSNWNLVIRRASREHWKDKEAEKPIKKNSLWDDGP